MSAPVTAARLLSPTDAPVVDAIDSAWSGSRAVTATEWPDRVNARASALPTLPDPMIAISMAGTSLGRGWRIRQSGCDLC
jgi:hypothetical protein